ncbi:4-hydroxy-tetrahydrodipicolinate reductase [Desulfurobacterium atlanticum]|uniref:4-hydroxy-tetrahydrodipicolinate reductase n=1 Tax=Desulfurobacterium atlanticum TaxID=240169 RepID=A0A238ZF41_9BACT|nr:4-hydroxy-tetrahydrodipicolinate reductase [Desulfurobacterium atlanticum]SNR81611.1 dihydrodipicolinate reductase [Desulfurobacterium atlanticum]
MIKIAVNGANGRMGRLIASLVKENEDMELVGVIENPESDLLGEPFDENLKFVGSLKEIKDKPDVVIDFTVPCATLTLVEDAVAEGVAVVTGTTGFSSEEMEKLKAAGKKIPLLFSPNMSLGVNILFRIVEEVTKALKDKDYDVEIFEIHHRFKKDAPSGTAMRLAEIVAKTLDRNPEDVFVFGRKGFVGERSSEEIGVLAARMGDVVGDHTVYFATFGERIELTHRATSRETFARGAVVAAKWIYGKPCGFYSMFDVLGI